MKLKNLSIVVEDGIIFFISELAGIEKGAPNASKTDSLVLLKIFFSPSPKDFDVDTYELVVGVISE